MLHRNRDDYFNVYEYRVEGVQFKILPKVKSSGTEWEIRVYRDGHQGPAFVGQKLTERTFAEYGLPEIPDEKRLEINEATDFANKYLIYDVSYNRKERGKAPVSKLAEIANKEAISD